MTCAVSADPLDGVKELLQRVKSQRAGVLGIEPGLTVAAPDAGWTAVAELVREPYGVLDGLIGETAERWGAARHVGGALFWKTYGYWHTMPMVLGWALNRRVPIMPFERTVFRVSEAGVTLAATEVTAAVLPDDPCAGQPGTIVVPDLGAAVRGALLDGQAPVVAAVARLTRLGRRTLWGSTAEALVQPLGVVADALPGDPAVEGPAFLAAVGGPVAGLLHFDGSGYRRRTCCLWITVPDQDACSTCCVLPGST